MNYALFVGVVGGSIIFQSMAGVVLLAFFSAMVHFFYCKVWMPYVSQSIWETDVSECFIALHAKMAKVDGVVSPSEIRTFRDVVVVSEQDEGVVSVLYDGHRHSSRGAEKYAHKLNKLAEERPDLRHMCIQGLCYVAQQNTRGLDVLQSPYFPYIVEVGYVLGFSREDVQTHLSIPPQFSSRSDSGAREAPAHEESVDAHILKPHYQCLGVGLGEDLVAVKRAYRQKLHALHPDKLQARHASCAEIAQAEADLREVQNAYEALKKALEKG